MGQAIGTLLPLRLLPLRLRLWLGNLLFRPLSHSTVRVSWHRIIKGPCDPPEVEAMQFVARHTRIPIPRIHAIHTEKKTGCIFIEMAYVEGECLDSAWDHLSTGERDAIFADIKTHLSCLRELQPPAQNTVSSALSNPSYDCRIGARFFGPMNHTEFHSLARGHLRMEDVAQFLGQEVAKVHTSRYQTQFTHADLNPRNIIVRHGRVAAILDWAYSGWYPEYWEFTKAHYNYFPGEDWEKYLRLALPSYETELAAERILWRRLPEPGTPATSYRDGVSVERPGSDPSATWLGERAGRQLTDLWSLVL
ncbi:kinase-like domain-containing protein [Fusarium flagelliforme]|nr:kinase-like domain-containing protein [Fusarium flagelliforme]KAH7184807.1 kinase-like domain-containing protein [Fusarium flagelliforme]